MKFLTWPKERTGELKGGVARMFASIFFIKHCPTNAWFRKLGGFFYLLRYRQRLSPLPFEHVATNDADVANSVTIGDQSTRMKSWRDVNEI